MGTCCVPTGSSELPSIWVCSLPHCSAPLPPARKYHKERRARVMQELGREGKAPTEMQGLTWDMSWGWEPPGLARVRCWFPWKPSKRCASTEEPPARQGGLQGGL